MFPATLRSKIILSSSIIMAVIASTTFYSALVTGEVNKSTGTLFYNNLTTKDIREIITESRDQLATYLRFKSSESLNGYLRQVSLLKDRAAGLNRDIKDDESLLLQRTLAGLIDRWILLADQAVEAKRGRNVGLYARSFEEAEYLLKLLEEVTQRSDQVFLSDSLTAYRGFSANTDQVLAYNIILVLVATSAGILLLVQFAYSISTPMVQLARAARAVGRGEFDYELPTPRSMDEIGTTIVAFTSMQHSILEAISALHAKAEVEKKLFEERVHAIEMDRKLKDAELLALQTQINPHFLFNTLFAGMQLAQIENARRTESFMENLGGFIRYALKSPLRLVSLAEEMESVRHYIWLLQLRFRERFIFVVEVESDELLRVNCPALILQPLVENAVNHGLRDREEGGVVQVFAKETDGSLHLGVSDNGVGMSPTEVDTIYREALVEERLHDGGIGLRNVVRRMYLSTGDLGCIHIASTVGVGTSIEFIFKLPSPESETAP